MSKDRKRVSTEGGQSLGENPFSGLERDGLPETGGSPSVRLPERSKAVGKDRGRLDVKRVKAGRGGKTVTVVSGWKGIANEEKAVLAKTIQKRCGAGGSLKAGTIEIQGDKREEAKLVLEEAGFRVVFAGG